MLASSATTGFPPIVSANARVLILGTLPSRKSLEYRQYYGHPQNQFWRIMGELFAAGPELPYAERVEVLCRCGVAVWDVLRSSVRPGSLDASIDTTPARPNSFSALLLQYPEIRTICFNGRKAEQLFQQLGTEIIGNAANELSYLSLPSTSPAHAAMSFEDKLLRWTAVKDAVERSTTTRGE